MRSRSASLREIANKNADLARQSTNKNLQSVKFIKTAQTLPSYRLHAAENGCYLAIYAVDSSSISISGEIYEMT